MKAVPSIKLTKEQRRAREATFPKCPCGNVLGRGRMAAGVKRCRGCQPDSEPLAALEGTYPPPSAPVGVSSAEREAIETLLDIATHHAARGADLQEKLTRAYSERNALAVAFARAAIAAGWPAGRGFDADPTKGWDDDWRHVIYVDLPNGSQVSWHISPDGVANLDGLPEYGGKWDGTFVARDPSWCLFDARPSATPGIDLAAAKDLLRGLEQLRDDHNKRLTARGALTHAALELRSLIDAIPEVQK